MPNSPLEKCPKCGGIEVWTDATPTVGCNDCDWRCDTFSVVSGQVFLGDRFNDGARAAFQALQDSFSDNPTIQEWAEARLAALRGEGGTG